MNRPSHLLTRGFLVQPYAICLFCTLFRASNSMNGDFWLLHTPFLPLFFLVCIHYPLTFHFLIFCPFFLFLSLLPLFIFPLLRTSADIREGYFPRDTYNSAFWYTFNSFTVELDCSGRFCWYVVKINLLFLCVMCSYPDWIIFWGPDILTVFN